MPGQPYPLVAELRALGHAQAVPRAELERALADLAPHLASYAEVVLTERGLELISGGKGRAVAADLARIADAHGAVAIERFLRCHERFPDRMLGLKLCLGHAAAAPTLYVRTMAPVAEVLELVATLPEHHAAVPELARELAENHLLYGLGFGKANSGEPLLKTYTLADVSVCGLRERVGFVSWRASGATVEREAKRYLPDLAWSDVPNADHFARLRSLLPVDHVGHLGVIERPGQKPEIKVYVERVGAIASDWSAR